VGSPTACSKPTRVQLAPRSVPAEATARANVSSERLEPALIETEHEGCDDHLAPEVAHQRCCRALADVDRDRQQALGFDASDAFDERPVQTTSDVAHDHLLV